MPSLIAVNKFMRSLGPSGRSAGEVIPAASEKDRAQARAVRPRADAAMLRDNAVNAMVYAGRSELD